MFLLIIYKEKSYAQKFCFLIHTNTATSIGKEVVDIVLISQYPWILRVLLIFLKKRCFSMMKILKQAPKIFSASTKIIYETGKAISCPEEIVNMLTY